MIHWFVALVKSAQPDIGDFSYVLTLSVHEEDDDH
jgi:hypothetical protein